MKKKLIIKESELEGFVKNFLNENQLELDFPKDSLTEMLEMKYQEIVDEIKSAIEQGNVDSLEMIYDEKIFNLTKNLHKLPKGEEIVNKFNTLEDALIDYTELHKEYQKIKNELDDTLENLNDLL
jgi:cytochrome b involved in lipid metabolism